MTLLMGPDIEGGLFKPVSIKSIHYKRMPVTHVVAGQTAALALKKTKKNQVRLCYACNHRSSLTPLSP